MNTRQLDTLGVPVYCHDNGSRILGPTALVWEAARCGTAAQLARAVASFPAEAANVLRALGRELGDAQRFGERADGLERALGRVSAAIRATLRERLSGPAGADLTALVLLRGCPAEARATGGWLMREGRHGLAKVVLGMH